MLLPAPAPCRHLSPLARPPAMTATLPAAWSRQIPSGMLAAPRSGAANLWRTRWWRSSGTMGHWAQREQLRLTAPHQWNQFSGQHK